MRSFVVTHVRFKCQSRPGVGVSGAGVSLLSRGFCGSCPPCAIVPFSPYIHLGHFFDASTRTVATLHAQEGSLLQELSTAAVQSTCESVTRSVPLLLFGQSVLSLSGLPQLESRTLAAVGPLRYPEVISNPEKDHLVFC